MKDCPKEVVTAGALSVMARQKLADAMEALAAVRNAASNARHALKTEGVPNVALAEGFMLLGHAEQALDTQMAAHGSWAKALTAHGYKLPSDAELAKEIARIEAVETTERPVQPRWR